jgi:drug/metabolite transporter (DMT)-like permease
VIYLLLSIIASTLIFIVFKSFNTLKINTLQAIVINYFTAFTCGVLSNTSSLLITDVLSQDWFIGATILGFLFISIFNVMALTAQRNGLSSASVASKMSVVIPIIFGLYAYNETCGWQKGIGIILALVAVYLTATKSNSDKFSLKGLWLPILLFFGSGLIDTTIKYIETTYVQENGIPIFTACIFLIAGCLGIGLLLFKRQEKTQKLHYKTIVGGIILGIINYYSIYLLLKALQFKGYNSSTIFTVNNVSIVMLSTLIGFAVFKEKISLKNWIGIATAIVSITLVTLA